MARERARDDVALGLAAGVVDVDLQHEAVELRLRQGVRALVLDRVLRGEHEERSGQRVCLAADRDLALLHRLEEGRLHLRRGAVDLVGEDHVREERAAAQPELAVRLMEDQRPGDVGGKQVRGELDAREGELQRLRERRDRERLRQPRHAFDERVLLGDERNEKAVDQAVLPDDDAGDLDPQALDQRVRRRALARR